MGSCIGDAAMDRRFPRKPSIRVERVDDVSAGICESPDKPGRPESPDRPDSPDRPGRPRPGRPGRPLDSSVKSSTGC